MSLVSQLTWVVPLVICGLSVFIAGIVIVGVIWGLKRGSVRVATNERNFDNFGIDRMDKCLRASCLFLLTLATLALSACSTGAPPVALDAVPVYPGAEHIDPSQQSTATAADRQAKQAMANGHKNEIRAFLLPAGTTGAQVKAFYVSKLTQLGGQVTIMLEDDAPFGNIILHRGMQALSIEYDDTDESQPPVLIIDSFIPNGNR